MTLKPIRLDKWLANAGIGSRAEVKKVLKSLRVDVNGERVKDPGYHVTPGIDVVAFDGEPVSFEQYAYFMMYKPQGFISATEDKRERVVVELLESEDSHFDVFPVGRLDKDAEGLLLLTNDGQLAHQLLSPKKHVPKRYFCRVEGVLTEDDVARLAAGVTLEDGYQTMPGTLEIVSSSATSEAYIVIYEGKFHQVKRMFLALGKQVTFLKRVQMGPLCLDETLQPGQYRHLSEKERAQLTSSGRKAVE